MDSTIYASYDLVQVSTIVCALVFLYVSQKKMIVSLRRLVVKIQCTIKYKVLCNKCQSLVLSPQEKNVVRSSSGVPEASSGTWGFRSTPFTTGYPLNKCWICTHVLQ